jgi:hypothetical protein
MITKDGKKRILEAQERGRETQRKNKELKIMEYNKNPNICQGCKNKFCSHKCAATITNKERAKEKIVKKCKNCNKDILNSMFCSNKCQGQYRTDKYFKKFLNGEIISEKSAKKALIRIYGEKCQKCGWEQKNPITGKCPIELHHKDANHNNNCKENIELLCPNCHSLTETYKNMLGHKSTRKNRK